ncbi:MAG: hypothetical protein ACRC6V_01790 [Bacteroidales bacterium]
MDLLISRDPISSEYGDIVWRNGPLRKEETTQSRVDVVAQRLLILLKTFKGEWFLDTEYGIGYFQSILGMKTSKSAVDLIFQKAILAENGVRELTFFESTFVNRQYSMSFRVRVSTGDETDTITVTPTS